MTHWKPPQRTAKITVPIATRLRQLVRRNHPLALRMQVELLRDPFGRSLTPKEQATIRADALELYKYVPATLVPLTVAQRWVNAATWPGATPILDDDDRLTWATFADQDALLSAIDTMAPRTAMTKALPNLSLGQVSPQFQQQQQPPPQIPPSNEVFNSEVAALAKVAASLSEMTPEEFSKHQWEAFFLTNALANAATPAGLAAGKADLTKRWEAAWKKEGGILNLNPYLNPKWWFLTSDGKPPAVSILLASALTNPDRSLVSRVQLLQSIPQDRRQEFEPMARLIYGDVAEGAGGANQDFIVKMRQVSKAVRGDTNWTELSPWYMFVPFGNEPAPIEILLAHQVGKKADEELSEWEKQRVADLMVTHGAWKAAMSDWNLTFLRDNPLSQLYTGVTEGAGQLGKGVKDLVKNTANTLGYIPYAIGGVALLVVGIVAVKALSSSGGRAPAAAAA